MQLRWKRGLLTAALVLALVWGAVFLGRWYGAGPLERDTAFVVPDGSTLTSVAAKLDKEGAIGSASGFLTRAKLLGGSDPIAVLRRCGHTATLLARSGGQRLEFRGNRSVSRHSVDVQRPSPT